MEAIRAQMLLRVQSRGEILAHRDAMVVSLQYGLCARNQEVWGLRWASLAGEFAWMLEVLSYRQLEDGARPNTAPNDAPLSRASCRKIYPSGGQRSDTQDIQSATATSSSQGDLTGRLEWDVGAVGVDRREHVSVAGDLLLGAISCVTFSATSARCGASGAWMFSIAFDASVLWISAT